MLFHYHRQYCFKFLLFSNFKNLNEFKELNVYQNLKFIKIFEVIFFYHFRKLFMFTRVRDFYIQEVTLSLFII